MKQSNFIILLTIFIIGSLIFFIAYWIYNRFEIISEEAEIGFQGEARDNPWLAAERLLQRMGTSLKRVQSFSNIENKLEARETLILLEYSTSLNEEQIQQLFKWIDTGGHLIMVSDALHDLIENTEKTQPDLLLAQLDIYQYQNGLDERKITQIPPSQFFWTQYHLQVAFSPDYYLESSRYDPAIEINDEYGTHLLFYYYGTGMISVLSDMAFIENDKIGEYDHAQFLWHLVHYERKATQVWLLHNKIEEGELADGTNGWNSSKNDMPSLWNLLWTNLWTVIISATMLLLFWLWTASRRFGSLLPEPSHTRRRLLEHIEASGYFLWQQKQAHLLLHSAKQALLKRLHSVHPDWTQLSDTQLSQQLAQICGLPKNEIETALQCTKPETEIAFTQTIQIFTQIRKAL